MVSYATQPELFQHKGCAGFVNGAFPKDGSKILSLRSTTAVRREREAVKLPPLSTGLRQAADALEEV